MIEVKHRGGNLTSENYKGIPIHAADGVHAKVAELILKNASKASAIADLGAGHGALSLRLHDQGYKVVAYDFDNSDWPLKEIPCHNLDVDKSLADMNANGPFSVICAIEIIEHLENPRAFLRGLVSVAKEHGTVLIISTPNPLDTFSCISLFTRGIFNWFSPAHYLGGGHISILPHWMISEHLKFLGANKFEWHFCAPYKHPSTFRNYIYRFISFLRRTLSYSKDKSFFEGQTALVVVYP